MKKLVDELIKIGVKKIVSCPGGRNQPLLELFETSNDFKVESFFDERSASFYALGLASKGEPVVVVTTSGSAVAECLPAMIEAKYQDFLPLIVLSADRPRELRYTGAPQTIPQQNIFKDFAESLYDFDLNEEDYKLNDLKFPAHINLCVGEPNPLKEMSLEVNFDQIIILSRLKPEDFKEVKLLLKNYKGVIVLEALSGFKEADFKQAEVIRQPDAFFLKMNIKSFKKIIRIGSVPVLKAWREADLCSSYYLEGYFPGAVKAKKLAFKELKDFILSSITNDDLKEIKEVNLKVKNTSEKLKVNYPQSEISLLSKLVNKIPETASLFVGNSLPVRELQHTEFDKGFKIFGQRGVNGIDGSLSFALGAMSDLNEEAWVILGDLTCLYDLQGFWPLLKKRKNKTRIVVMNNFGGQIFKKIFDKEYMLNGHQLNFKALADFWGLDYKNDLELNSSELESNQVLIELNPDNKQSKAFWTEQVR